MVAKDSSGTGRQPNPHQCHGVHCCRTSTCSRRHPSRRTRLVREPLQQAFLTGIPKLAKLLIRTDNSPSKNWAHKVSAKSERGNSLSVCMPTSLNELHMRFIVTISRGPPILLPILFPDRRLTFHLSTFVTNRYSAWLRNSPLIAFSARVQNCYRSWNPGYSPNNGW